MSDAQGSRVLVCLGHDAATAAAAALVATTAALFAERRTLRLGRWRDHAMEVSAAVFTRESGRTSSRKEDRLFNGRVGSCSGRRG